LKAKIFIHLGCEFVYVCVFMMCVCVCACVRAYVCDGYGCMYLFECIWMNIIWMHMDGTKYFFCTKIIEISKFCFLLFKWNLNQNHNTLYCGSYTYLSSCETIPLESFKADGFNWKQAFKYFFTNYLIIIIKSTFVALFRLIQFTTNSFFIQLYIIHIYNMFECAYCTSICKNKKSKVN